MSYSYDVTVINGVKIQSKPHLVTTVLNKHQNCPESTNNLDIAYCSTCGRSNIEQKYTNQNLFEKDEDSGSQTYENGKYAVVTGHEACRWGESPIFIGKVLKKMYAPREGDMSCKLEIENDFDYGELAAKLISDGWEVLDSGIFLVTEIL